MNTHDSEPFLAGRKTTFREAYPQIATLELEITCSPTGFGKIAQYFFSLDNPPKNQCGCHNPHCSDGGFDVGYFIDSLISKKQTQCEVTAQCCGLEKLGRSGSSVCRYRFKAKAKITYKG